MLKRAYFLAVIDGVFCVNARVIYKRETLSVVMLDGSEITGTCKTSDTMVKVRRTKCPVSSGQINHLGMQPAA